MSAQKLAQAMSKIRTSPGQKWDYSAKAGTGNKGPTDTSKKGK